MARILIVERDAEDPALWRYGLAGDDGRLGDDVYELHADDPDEGPPDDVHGASLWVTAILLIRQAGEPTRIAYNLRPWEAEDAPEPPPRPPGGRWERSTAGKSKGRGETLSQRAERVRDGQPRAAA